MIITVTLNPALEHRIETPDLRIGCVCRAARSTPEIGGRGLRISEAIRALGGHSVTIAVLGGATGEYIRDRLDQLGICNDWVKSHAITRASLRLQDPKSLRETIIELPGAALTAKELREVQQKLDDLVEPGDTVLFAGLNPPELPERLLADWIERLRSAGVRTALDVDGLPMKLGAAAGPTLLMLDTDRLSSLFEAPLSGLPALASAARKVTDNGIASAAVFLGRDGLLLAGGGQVFRASGDRTIPEEFLGAGLLLALEHGGEARELAACAVAAGTFSDAGSDSAPTWEKICQAASGISVERVL